MKKEKLLLTAFIFSVIMFFIIGCKKDTFVPEPKFNAIVIGFNDSKVYCIYGWMIVMGNDTILTTSNDIMRKVGFEIIEPVKLNIKILEVEDFCKYPYCKVKLIDNK